MTKAQLKQALKNYRSICAELQDLTDQLARRRLEEAGGAGCSSADFPFGSDPVRTEGYTPGANLEQQIRHLQKVCADVLEEVSQIEDSLVRRIIRYRYLQKFPLSWEGISRRMGYHSESTVRSILSRYFVKI